jgi:lysyl-tRNA synthetase class 2
MNLHPEVRERFVRRAKFWNSAREFYIKNGFVEVNIPVLEHTTGGADAKPFITHYDALNEDFYLRISHELPLKRLIGAGFTKVFDIGPRFRNEGFSDEHLPEHVAMEWYWAYADYNDGMKLTEEMFRYIMQEVYGTLKFNIRGFEIDLSQDWERIDYAEIIKEKFGVDIYNDDLEKMNGVLKENGVDLGSEANKNRVVDNLWKLIRKTISGPAFLINEPKFMSPLAKLDENNPNVTQRFHAIIAGSELVNAYSELNDPLDQLDRFLEQEELRKSGDDEAQMLDVDFVEMLEYGMPPTCGWGMSERVFWFFEGVTAKEGVPFPQLRHDFDNITKDIYPEIFS